jgi:hypothetical protein
MLQLGRSHAQQLLCYQHTVPFIANRLTFRDITSGSTRRSLAHSQPPKMDSRICSPEVTTAGGHRWCVTVSRTGNGTWHASQYPIMFRPHILELSCLFLVSSQATPDTIPLD